ncbi:hypothetical protein AcV7_007237 [Taiwanofungus camphoratus]|nr:hypothetical protein AcV7_007237 [Antrodia cinnamomea]
MFRSSAYRLTVPSPSPSQSLIRRRAPQSLPPPTISRPLELRLARAFQATRRCSDFHFDTHHFVQRLEREGLNRAQAEGIMSAMAEVIDESIRNMTSNMVTKADQEKHHYTQQVDFAQLKSELQLMEKNELAMVKAENDRLMTDIEKLKQRLREEITRTQAGVRLDLNLEKGRLREESSKQELKIKEVDTRIEQEISSLRTAIQASKATTLQYLVGFGKRSSFVMLLWQNLKASPIVTGCSALLMAYLRFRV